MVDEKVLNSYVGTYEIGRGTFVVSRVGRALAIQQTGQAAINELLAETSVRFFERGSTVKFMFEGEGGRIDRLVVEAGGQRLTANRRKSL